MYKLVGRCALLHFLVDGLCACCLYLVVWPSTTLDILTLFIIYNVLAFLTQPLTGLLVDTMKHKHWALFGTMLLFTLAVLLSIVLTASPSTLNSPPSTIYLLPILLGIGNSLFHVWGGQLVAVRTGNDIRALGIYVATGALGLAVGVVFASWPLLWVLLLAICGIGALQTHPQPLPEREGSNMTNPVISSSKVIVPLPLREGLGVGLILLLVALRSAISTTFSGAMEKTTVVFLLVGFVSMLGKAFGGFLCKWMGMLWACVLMVLGVAVLFFTLNSSPSTLHPPLGFAAWLSQEPSTILPLLGLFLVNCTMPVTLYFANVLLKGREGLAFGLLAAVLMPGYLMAVGTPSTLHSPLSTLNYFLLPLIATIVLELGVLWLMRERRATVLWASVVINIVTNVILNLILFNGPHPTPAMHILVGELTVVVVETLWYFWFVRNWRQAIAYGVLCNAISYLTGLFVQLIYFLIF